MMPTDRADLETLAPSTVEPHAWLLHDGAAPDSYELHLNRDRVDPSRLPSTWRIATGRQDLSRWRLRDRLVEALRREGLVGGDDGIDLSGASFELVLLDELIFLGSSYDNRVRPVSGRVPGMYLPAALAARAVQLGGPWLSSRVGERAAGERTVPTGAVARPPPEAVPMLELHPEPGSEHRAMERYREDQMGVGVFAGLAATFALFGVLTAGSHEPVVTLLVSLALLIPVAITVQLTTPVNLVSGATSLLRQAIGRGRAPVSVVRRTNRFRDALTGRVGTYVGMERRPVVSWSDEPDTPEELCPRALERYGLLGEDLVVDRETGRRGRQIDRVTRLRVRWDGATDDQLLAASREADFEPLVERRE